MARDASLQPLLDALGWELQQPGQYATAGDSGNAVVIQATLAEVRAGISVDMIALFTAIAEETDRVRFRLPLPAGSPDFGRYRMEIGWDDPTDSGDIDIQGHDGVSDSGSSNNPERTTTSGRSAGQVLEWTLRDYNQSFGFPENHEWMYFKFWPFGVDEPADPAMPGPPVVPPLANLPANWSGRGTADNPFSFKLDRPAPNWLTEGYVVDITAAMNAIESFQDPMYFGGVELPGGPTTSFHMRVVWESAAIYNFAGAFQASNRNSTHQDTSEGNGQAATGGLNRAWRIERFTGQTFSAQRGVYMVIWPTTLMPRPRVPGEPLPVPPQAPTPGRVRGVSPTTTTSITVVTDAEPGATSYRILYGTTTIIENAQSVVVVPATVGDAVTRTVTGLQPGTRYIFWLAITRAGEAESEPSDRRGLWTLPVQPPDPTSVVNTQFAILSAEVVQGADRYRWRVWESSQDPAIFGYVVDSVTEVPTFQTPTLTQGAFYSFTVEAGNNSGYGVPSNVMAFLLDTQVQNITGTITRVPFHRPWQNGDGATIGGPVRGDELNGVAADADLLV